MNNFWLRLFFFWCGCLPVLIKAEEPRHAARPRLVVVLSIDQFRGDYVRRFEDLYGPDGFQRLRREGFNYDQCYYSTANTETGPGHACMLTGAYSHLTGITQNGWFDATAGRQVNCVEDTTATQISSSGPELKPGSFSPRNLLTDTVGDVLKVAAPGSKVVGLSFKDRSAILMGGHSADLAVWYDANTGELVTSDWYVQRQPNWLNAFNRKKIVNQWFKKSWALSLPPQNYEQRCTVDDYPAESTWSFATRTFPHQLDGEGSEPDEKYYNQLFASPFGNDFLVQAAFAAMDGENMGMDDTPDLLTISFSSNDLVGHAFGPDSWEVMDACLKTDKSIAELLAGLDAKVGEGRWTLFLTADHGVDNLPEVLRDHHIDARRIPSTLLSKGLQEHLTDVFDAQNTSEFISRFGDPWIVLNPKSYVHVSGGRNALIVEIVNWLNEQPAVAFAISTSDLLARPILRDRQLEALRLAYYPGRCGDIAYVLKPHYQVSDGMAGTGHGTLYRYDQYVAMLLCGTGIRHGESVEPVEPIQIAPTIAHLIGIMPPAQCEAAVLATALSGIPH